MAGMEDPRPNRRWFRFSLRTLLVATTIIAVWLGVQVKWIRDRHEILAKHQSLAASVNAQEKRPQCGGAIRLQAAQRQPVGLWILGEPAVPFVQVILLKNDEMQIDDFDDEDGRRAKALFPEAEILLRTVHFYPEPETH